MIYITGDIHGEPERLKADAVRRLKKSDTLIVCGDFGFIWDGSEKEQSLLKKIGRMKPQILFVPGCHDNYDLLAKYPEVDFCGGKAKMLRGDGHVNGAVRLAVGLAYPLLPFPATDDEAGRHLAEPAAVVAGGQLGEHSLICNVREVPRLKVDGRRSQTDALHDVAEHVFWYGVGTERAYRAPRAAQVEKSFH